MLAEVAIWVQLPDCPSSWKNSRNPCCQGSQNESPTYRSVADGSSIGLSPWCSNSFSLEKRVMQSFASR